MIWSSLSHRSITILVLPLICLSNLFSAFGLTEFQNFIQRIARPSASLDILFHSPVKNYFSSFGHTDFITEIKFCSAFGLAKQPKKFNVVYFLRKNEVLFGLAKQPRTAYVAAFLRVIPPTTLHSISMSLAPRTWVNPILIQILQ